MNEMFFSTMQFTSILHFASFTKTGVNSAEISIRKNERSDEGPEVESQAQPTGAHLHPHSWHCALHRLGGGVRLVPVGQGHHDVKRGQTKMKVEKAVAVRDAIFLIIHSSAYAVLPDHTLTSGASLLCLHQLVYLGIAGGADTSVESAEKEND